MGFIEIADGATLDANPASGTGVNGTGTTIVPSEPADLPQRPILPATEPGWSLWGDIDR
jgi:hypothetical protein